MFERYEKETVLEVLQYTGRLGALGVRSAAESPPPGRFAKKGV